MVTERQIRAARALVGWSAEELASQAGITRATVSNIENKSVAPRTGTIERILQVFEKEGVEFIGTRGVELKNNEIITINGDHVFFKLLDDVMATLKGIDKAEALFACVADKVSTPVVIENYRNLRKLGISMRSLVREGDTYLMGELEEYRYIPAQFFHNNATIIYGRKFATMILDPETGEDFSAVIIQNPHVAEAQRNLFNLIWSNAKTPHETTAEVRYGV